MTVYCWYSDNQAVNNQDNWDKIRFWWESLNGCNVKLCRTSGSYLYATLTHNSDLTIYSPRLGESYLEYNGSKKIIFKKLELNISNNTLDVSLSNSSQNYRFTLNSAW
ncbi:hypothetical protein Cylst_2998 [Cylindrospermum stagnale PCC 7417]|uniref:Uncharacterized protein n=1 Tax=Cylindrospermum stagnale PCC 7417 TaxID=56107 RepID=K9WZC9_9NOST|nr:hypothetical protein Cylst_2998 [Cylindrospermum stagnale PCC 7417]